MRSNFAHYIQNVKMLVHDSTQKLQGGFGSFLCIETRVHIAVAKSSSGTRLHCEQLGEFREVPAT